MTQLVQPRLVPRRQMLETIALWKTSGPLTSVLVAPGGLPPAGWDWLWDLYQRSNFIKNVCLLGGCVHFLYHEPGRYSLQALLDARLDAAKRDR